jgi:cell division protein FtsI/penicillin-binding protein 2
MYLKEIGKVPLLTSAEEIELAKQKEKGDKEAEKKIIEANLRLVVSIAKKFAGAKGLDAGKINPDTTYVDAGLEVIDGLPIRNSDKEAHGVQTMKDVLIKSLNTGTIFVQRLLGRELLQRYVHAFGFGEKTGIQLKSEVDGDIDSLERKGKVFAATASYGQGITTTPLQMVQSFAALGNGGKLMKPYIVSEVIRPDGTREMTKPQVIRQPIKPQTSRLITAMMVNVVEQGHGKRAAVPGYYVAGKTGTAQVSDPRGGYLKDETIGSFAGYAPADNPAFVMLVKIDRPRTVQFAESSAAPIFGELASFLLSYLQVPPARPIKVVPPSTPIISPVTSSSTR